MVGCIHYLAAPGLESQYYIRDEVLPHVIYLIAYVSVLVIA